MRERGEGGAVMVIPRCQQRGMHQTHDASEGAARKLEIARLPTETRMSCDCGNGESKPADQRLRIRARYFWRPCSHVPRPWAGCPEDDGRQRVCLPGAWSKRLKDAGKPLTLADLNKIHSEFYRRGDL